MSAETFEVKLNSQLADLLVELCEDELGRLALDLARWPSHTAEHEHRLALLMEAHQVLYRATHSETLEQEGPVDGQHAHPPGSRDTHGVDPETVP